MDSSSAGLTLPRPSSSALEFNKSAVNRGRKCLAPQLLETCRHLKIPSSRFCSLLLNEQPSGRFATRPVDSRPRRAGRLVDSKSVRYCSLLLNEQPSGPLCDPAGRFTTTQGGTVCGLEVNYGIVPYYSKNSRPGRFATRPVNSRPRRAGKNVSRHLARLDSSRVTLSCDHRA